MKRTVFDRCLDSHLVAPVSAAISLMIGLAFIFVGSPLPWGWYGIDHYHEMAVGLAEGRGFPTLHVPWGYAYFLSLFYRVFGATPMPALVAQAVLNALIPLVVYAYASRTMNRRVAAMAAFLVAGLSFNTVYVSTESTDSVATVLFMVMVWAFVRARQSGHWGWFSICGVLGGVAAQFRPNLVLLPLVLAALHWVLGAREWRRVREGAIIVVAASLMLAPWTLRNHRLTGEFIPTSTHGGVQLWYGTLQVGPYLKSRAHNPRTVFSSPVFDYTSLLHAPLLVSAFMNCAPGVPQGVEFMYRTDTEREFQRLPLTVTAPGRYTGTLAATLRNTWIEYYTVVSWQNPVDGVRVKTTPDLGEADPLVFFVSADHTGDLDGGDRLLDLFDVVRMLRHLAWDEPVRAADQLDRDRNGQIDEADLRANLRLMLRELDRGEPSVDRLEAVISGPESVRAQFVDGSALAVPRRWKGRVTDLEIGQGVSESLIRAFHRFAQPFPTPRVPLEIQCLGPGEIAINAQYYRVQPHEMRRYTALALDNIGRDPVAYGWSVLYRAVRLFVIQGSDDRSTAQQFEGSRLVYAGATLLSGLYLLLFSVGVWVAARRGFAVWLPLALIAYIPATIAFVLTNMRYTITVQPLLLMFVAVSVVAALQRLSLVSPDEPPTGSRPSGHGGP